MRKTVVAVASCWMPFIFSLENKVFVTVDTEVVIDRPPELVIKRSGFYEWFDQTKGVLC